MANDPIFLLSSNIRPQYEQDIVDVVASAQGSLKRFRYEEKYVEPALRADWTDNKLVGRECVVVYSIQQPSGYHEPAYLPIRRGTITRTSSSGSLLVVEFQVGSYAPLRSPTDNESRGELVHAFTVEFSETAAGHPGSHNEKERFSAVSASPSGITVGNTEDHGFERNVQYLSNTVSFASHAFWRIANVAEVGARKRVDPDRQGRFRMYSGKTYEITITHFQLAFPIGTATEPPQFEATTDEDLVEIVGSTDFTIASRYDALPIRVRIPNLGETRETYLSIRPKGGTRGPSADLHLFVGPTTKRRFTMAGIGATAAILLAIGSLMDEFSFQARFAPLFGAAVLAFILGFHAIPARTK